MGDVYRGAFMVSGIANDALRADKAPPEQAADWFRDNYSKIQYNYNRTIDAEPYLEAQYQTISTLGAGFFFDVMANQTVGPNNLPRIVFGTRGKGRASLHITYCTLETVYVDTQVTCHSQGGRLGQSVCGVSAIRRKPNPPTPPNMTILTPPDDLRSLAFNIARSSRDVTQQLVGGRSGTSSISEFYMQNPITAFWSARNSLTDLGTTVPIDVFQERWSLLFNTLFDATSNDAAIVGGDFNFAQADRTLNATSALTFALPPTYALDVAWVVVYFLSVFVVFVAAILAMILHWTSRAPGAIFGYVSSLMRDSVYFTGVPGNSAEPPAEKTRRLARMEVMIGDVKGGEEVGKIAVVPVSGGHRIRKRRWYE
jgi:hypothetical protein